MLPYFSGIVVYSYGFSHKDHDLIAEHVSSAIFTVPPSLQWVKKRLQSGMKLQSAANLGGKKQYCCRQLMRNCNLRLGLKEKSEKLSANREEISLLLAVLRFPKEQPPLNKQLIGVTKCHQIMTDYNSRNTPRCSKLIGRGIKFIKKLIENARATWVRGAGWPLDRSRSYFGTPSPGCYGKDPLRLWDPFSNDTEPETAGPFMRFRPDAV
jgi:hypothetical protein